LQHVPQFPNVRHHRDGAHLVSLHGFPVSAIDDKTDARFTRRLPVDPRVADGQPLLRANVRMPAHNRQKSCLLQKRRPSGWIITLRSGCSDAKAGQRPLAAAKWPIASPRSSAKKAATRSTISFFSSRDSLIEIIRSSPWTGQNAAFSGQTHGARYVMSLMNATIRFASRKPIFRWNFWLCTLSSSASDANSRHPRDFAQPSPASINFRATPPWR